MKHVVKIPSKVVGLGLLFTCSLASCELLNPAQPCPEPEYCPFMSMDKQWQQFLPETQWVFENQRHQRRTYRVGEVRSEVKQPNWYNGSYSTFLDYYQDKWSMRIERTDSVASIGMFTLTRIPVHHQPSYLSAQFYWTGFGGDYYGEMLFGRDLMTLNLHNQTVQGVNYPKAISFRKSTTWNSVSSHNTLENTTELDYDQAAGVIRFVTANGNVWERMQ